MTQSKNTKRVNKTIELFEKLKEIWGTSHSISFTVHNVDEYEVQGLKKKTFVGEISGNNRIVTTYDYGNELEVTGITFFIAEEE